MKANDLVKYCKDNNIDLIKFLLDKRTKISRILNSDDLFISLLKSKLD